MTYKVIPASEVERGDPILGACIRCWERWERRVGLSEDFSQAEVAQAVETYGEPPFNAQCPICVSEFEEQVQAATNPRDLILHGNSLKPLKREFNPSEN